MLEGSVEGLREECLKLERERKKMAEEQGALHTSVGELREEHARLEEERELMAQEQERMAKEKHALQRSLVKLEEEVRLLSLSLSQVREGVEKEISVHCATQREAGERQREREREIVERERLLSETLQSLERDREKFLEEVRGLVGAVAGRQ